LLGGVFLDMEENEMGKLVQDFFELFDFDSVPSVFHIGKRNGVDQRNPFFIVSLIYIECILSQIFSLFVFLPPDSLNGPEDDSDFLQNFMSPLSPDVRRQTLSCPPLNSFCSYPQPFLLCFL
jgi:hypothetical protein